jgi:hypothetical protein
MSTTNVNGRFRPTLAEQIDRLDKVLDGLAEGLNEAVATAVKAAVGVAVKEAVQAVLTEILANPAIPAKLAGVATPATPPGNATPKPRLRDRLGHIWTWIGAQLCWVGQAAHVWMHVCQATCRMLLRRTRQACRSTWARLRIVQHFSVQFLVALVIGGSVGTAAYFAGPWLAAGVSAAGGFATTLAVQAGFWLRRTFGVAAATPA